MVEKVRIAVVGRVHLTVVRAQSDAIRSTVAYTFISLPPRQPLGTQCLVRSPPNLRHGTIKNEVAPCTFGYSIQTHPREMDKPIV